MPLRYWSWQFSHTFTQGWGSEGFYWLEKEKHTRHQGADAIPKHVHLTCLELLFFLSIKWSTFKNQAFLHLKNSNSSFFWREKSEPTATACPAWRHVSPHPRRRSFSLVLSLHTRLLPQSPHLQFRHVLSRNRLQRMDVRNHKSSTMPLSLCPELTLRARHVLRKKCTSKGSNLIE